jgi:hypothetical protein
MKSKIETLVMRAAMILAAGLGAPGLAATAAPPGGGTVSIERARAEGQPAPATAAVDDAVDGAVGEALGERGFTLLSDPGHSAYVVDLTLSRADAGTGSARVERERGTVTPGGVAGVGGGVTLPLGGARSRSVPLERVTLELWLRKRGVDAVLWHGVAVTVRAGGTRPGRDDVIAADLTRAMLRFYPNPPPGVVAVP